MNCLEDTVDTEQPSKDTLGKYVPFKKKIFTYIKHTTFLWLELDCIYLVTFQGLQEALDDDWMNLPYRNLGRDDRVVSDHGRQLRTPYLDEDVVEFLKSLECWEK